MFIGSKKKANARHLADVACAFHRLDGAEADRIKKAGCSSQVEFDRPAVLLAANALCYASAVCATGEECDPLEAVQAMLVGAAADVAGEQRDGGKADEGADVPAWAELVPAADAQRAVRKLRQALRAVVEAESECGRDMGLIKGAIEDMREDLVKAMTWEPC